MHLPKTNFLIITFTCILFSSQFLIGQNLKLKEESISLDEEEPSYRLGILTNCILKNPGINLNYQKPISYSIKEGTKRNIKTLSINTNLGFFWDPKTHVATYINAGINRRKTNAKNRQWLLAINPIGVMRTFVHEAYEVNESLEVTRKRIAGRSYYAPEIIFGTGKIKNDRTRFFNIHLMILTKSNLGIFPLIHFEFGYKL